MVGVFVCKSNLFISSHNLEAPISKLDSVNPWRQGSIRQRIQPVLHHVFQIFQTHQPNFVICQKNLYELSSLYPFQCQPDSGKRNTGFRKDRCSDRPQVIPKHTPAHRKLSANTVTANVQPPPDPIPHIFQTPEPLFLTLA